jgi:hypothetical protein
MNHGLRSCLQHVLIDPCRNNNIGTMTIAGYWLGHQSNGRLPPFFRSTCLNWIDIHASFESFIFETCLPNSTVPITSYSDGKG